MLHFLCNFKVISNLFVLLVCIALTSGCDTGPSRSSSDEPALTVVDFNWKIGEYGNKFIAGTLRNNSEKEYSYVEVEFNLFDDSSIQVGSAIANVNNLEPHGTWNFEAIVAIEIEDKATKAKLKNVIGF